LKPAKNLIVAVHTERHTKTGNQEKVSCFFAPIFGIFRNRQYYAVQRGIKRNFSKFPPIWACVVL